MHLAASSGNPKLIRYLVSIGIDVNIRGHYNKTPLHYAAYRGNHLAVLFLLDLGAEVNALNDCGFSPLVDAIDNPHQDSLAIAITLMEHGASDPLALAGAARYGYKEIVESHIKLEVNLERKGRLSNAAPLTQAIWYQQYEIAELLLEGGANVDVVDGSNDTPLSWLSGRRDDVKFAELLLRYGANINHIGWNGKTPLQNAEAKGHAKLIHLLKKCISTNEIEKNYNAFCELSISSDRNSIFHHVPKALFQEISSYTADSDILKEEAEDIARIIFQQGG